MPTRRPRCRARSIYGQCWVPVDDTAAGSTPMAGSPSGRSASRAQQVRRRLRRAFRGRRRLHSAAQQGQQLPDRPQLQKTRSFTGITGVSEQDAAIQDSQGPIEDRTREHLGPTDIGILDFRKLVMDAARALQQGERALASGAPGPLHRALRRLRHQQGQGSGRGHDRALRRRGRLCRPARAGMRRRSRAALPSSRAKRRDPSHGRRVFSADVASSLDVRGDMDARLAGRRHNGILRYSRLARLASSRSRSRSIRRRVSSVILPSRSRTWMNLRSAAISSRVRSMPAAETSCCVGIERIRQAGWCGSRAARAAA